MKLLLADDERDLSNAVRKVLEMNSYEVVQAYDGEEALLYLSSAEFDLVILDVMMPKMDGIEVVRTLRKNGNTTPVLMLTAKAMIDDKVLGLDSGADDYLTKPFSLKELLARIKALLRRKNEMREKLSFSNMSLDADAFELCAIKRVRLTNKEYKIMEYLMNHPNTIVSTERIFSNVWEFDSDSELSGVWVYISSLRKKMKEIEADCVISVARGVGYRLEKK